MTSRSIQSDCSMEGVDETSAISMEGVDETSAISMEGVDETSAISMNASASMACSSDAPSIPTLIFAQRTQ